MPNVTIVIPEGKHCCSDTNVPLCCPLYHGDVDDLCALYPEEILDTDDEGFVLKCKQCINENK